MSSAVVPTSTLEAKQDNVRYGERDLEEFRRIIKEKVEMTTRDLALARETLIEVEAPRSMEETSGAVSRLDAQRTAERAERFLAELEAALTRTYNGTYGVCRISGQLIPRERLRLVPHATTTVRMKVS